MYIIFIIVQILSKKTLIGSTTTLSPIYSIFVCVLKIFVLQKQITGPIELDMIYLEKIKNKIDLICNYKIGQWKIILMTFIFN